MTGAEGRTIEQLTIVLPALSAFLVTVSPLPRHFQLGLAIWSTIKRQFIVSMAVLLHCVLPASFYTEYRLVMWSRSQDDI